MKKYILILLSFSFLIILNSCEEDFNIKADFKEEYALFSIVNGDTTYQYAVISKSYSAPGFNPEEYNGNPFIEDATVRLFYKGNQYLMKDSSATTSDGKEFPIYYTNEVQPDIKSQLRIEAELPNGNILKGNTTTPRTKSLSFATQDLESDYVMRGQEEGLFFIWQFDNNADLQDVMYLPSLRINYYKSVDGNLEENSIQVPVSFIQKDNKYLPQFPIISTRRYISYDNFAVNKIMQDIAKGDPEKENYFIKNAEFDVIILDDNLAPYYFSIQTFLDGFTVILDQQDYSNIEGGYGVFGSFFKQTHDLIIEPDYIRSYGYKTYN